jgi:hypothetical protein
VKFVGAHHESPETIVAVTTAERISEFDCLPLIVTPTREKHLYEVNSVAVCVWSYMTFPSKTNGDNYCSADIFISARSKQQNLFIMGTDKRKIESCGMSS